MVKKKCLLVSLNRNLVRTTVYLFIHQHFHLHNENSDPLCNCFCSRSNKLSHYPRKNFSLSALKYISIVTHIRTHPPLHTPGIFRATDIYTCARHAPCRLSPQLGKQFEASPSLSLRQQRIVEREKAPGTKLRQPSPRLPKISRIPSSSPVGDSKSQAGDTSLYSRSRNFRNNRTSLLYTYIYTHTQIRVQRVVKFHSEEPATFLLLLHSTMSLLSLFVPYPFLPLSLSLSFLAAAQNTATRNCASRVYRGPRKFRGIIFDPCAPICMRIDVAGSSVMDDRGVSPEVQVRGLAIASIYL